MGLFDRLLGSSSDEPARFTSREAFAALVLAVVAADGNLADDEVRAANAVFNRMRLFAEQSSAEFDAMISRLVSLLRRHGGDWLRAHAVEALPAELRETAFAIVADLVFADGRIEPEERELLEKLQVELRVPDELALQVVEVVALKNRG